jgi:hypothetical protein
MMATAIYIGAWFVIIVAVAVAMPWLCPIRYKK